MTELRLYDTLAREKRVFEPADPTRITMYVCGPTVYNRAHIGNARPAVVFDVLSRLLRHRYGADNVVYARNVTDIEDKIIKAAAEEGVDPSVITARYEQHYLDDMSALGVASPDIAPHATEHVAEMIAMIARLIETGNAYEAEGHVLFHVPSDPDYGALGRRDRDAMVAGARVEVAAYKKDPADFVLWKPSPAGVIGWDSPWGRGRPGWHIECSAMIERHLGTTIDIHAGGLDLIFPHHENELAQSRCAHGGAPLARYWVHNGFLSMAGSEKMSKSLGNVVTVGELLEGGWSGDVLRLALLSAHYRQPLEWSEALTKASANQFERWRTLVSRIAFDHPESQPDSELVAALNDDLNTPAALARLAKLLDTANFELERVNAGQTDHQFGLHANNFLKSAKLLGFFRSVVRHGIDSGVMQFDLIIGLDGRILSTKEHLMDRIEARTAAKKRRDFAEADRIRAELADEGILLEDTAAGTTWRCA